MLLQCTRIIRSSFTGRIRPTKLFESAGYATSTDLLPKALLTRARSLQSEHTRLTQTLNDHYDAETSKKVGSLAPIATAVKSWDEATASLAELKKLAQDHGGDEELRALALDEIEQANAALPQLSAALKTSLIPPHPFAGLPCLIEIRPGAGGDEAALFAGDLLRMYQAYCRRLSLQHSILKLDSTSGVDDQVQEAILEIASPGSYETFRTEAGVHRVQRVPATETKGRTHTSAVAVVVLPQLPEDGGGDDGALASDDPKSDYYINPTDVRTDTMRARGAGGQHVNTTDSAIRLTHIPSGTVVSMQESRSQHQNRHKAWLVLRARLAQARREAREEELAAVRLKTVGVGRMGRGDKVRTYNWSQQRVTDHRSGISLNRLDDVIEGGPSLEEVMNHVKEWVKINESEAMMAEEESKLKRE